MTVSSPIQTWTHEPLSRDVRTALERLARADDVVRVAAMPDVHLAADVCIGTVVATERTLYPAAVGGDIGCGMSAIRFDADVSAIDDRRTAARILDGLGRAIPIVRRAARDSLPEALESVVLSDPGLERLKRRVGREQFGTLGRGNHFVELQSDAEDGLWLMVHSGSRRIGQAIRDHHVALGRRTTGGFSALDVGDERGQAYLHDLTWALAYAAGNRAEIVRNVAEVMRTIGVEHDDRSYVCCHHNHVRAERIGGRDLWIHRKGAISAREGERGIIPGSMGTASFHVVGRGCAAALYSSSHGAGRRMSRTAARKVISASRLQQQLEGVWFDHRLASRLRDEAPEAYKDIDDVMRAQRALTRVERALRPVVSYKGG